jgi:hypothetical protein
LLLLQSPHHPRISHRRRHDNPGDQQRRRLRKLAEAAGQSIASESDLDLIERRRRSLLAAGAAIDAAALCDCALLLTVVARRAAAIFLRKSSKKPGWFEEVAEGMQPRTRSGTLARSQA